MYNIQTINPRIFVIIHRIFRRIFIHATHQRIDTVVVQDEHLIFPLRADAIPLAKFHAATKWDPNCSLTPAILFIRLVWPKGEGMTGKYVRVWMRVMLVAGATIEGLPFQLYTGINIESTRFSAKSTESSSIDYSTITARRDSLGKYLYD